MAEFCEDVPFVVPAHRSGVRWELVLDTRAATGQRRHRAMRGGEAYLLEGRSLALLRFEGRR